MPPALFPGIKLEDEDADFSGFIMSVALGHKFKSDKVASSSA